jgi:hypothetical protein
MSNYTPVTNFGSKDSLTTGNALKALKGAELTTEFTTIQTAVNSKFDGSAVYAPDGAAVQPSFGFTNNAGTGVYNVAGVLGVATGGIARFTISTTGAVNIPVPTSGTGLVVSGAPLTYAQQVIGSSTSGQSLGLLIKGGTTSADAGLTVQNQAASLTFLQVFGDGHTVITDGGTGTPLTLNSTLGTGGYLQWQNSGTAVYFAGSGADLDGGVNTDFTLRSNAALGLSSGGANRRFTVSTAGGLFAAGATGGDKGVGTVNTTGLFVNGTAVGAGGSTGSFTGTLTGMTAGTTGTVNYTVSNGICSLYITADILGTSNASTMTMTGLPAAVQPAAVRLTLCGNIQNSSGTTYMGSASIAGGTITFLLATGAPVQISNTFTTSGGKGLNAGWTVTYPL